jgi:hypothetical protein
MDCNPNINVTYALSVGYVLFEYWLGKTKAISPNSTLELLLKIVVAVITLLKNRGNTWLTNFQNSQKK